MKKLAIIATTLGFLSPLFFSGTAQAQSLASKRVCLQSGKYVVFAQHPLLFGAWNVQGLLNYWLPPELRRPGGDILPGQDITNTELSHEHIFFCDNGEIVDNIGFGPDGRFQYSKKSLDSGKEPNGSNVDNFVPIDRNEKYNSNIVRLVLTDSPAILPDRCVLEGDGKYLGIGHNCQNFTAKIREEYWRKMFVGTWRGNGYTCERGGLTEEVQISVSGNSLVAKKITGDNCVPAGNITFQGTIPQSVSKGSSFSVTFKTGWPDRPACCSAENKLSIVDANTFTAWGIRFTRID
ncbi:MAG: hypothetical protein U7126_25590 [Microcoleus sp.]